MDARCPLCYRGGANRLVRLILEVGQLEARAEDSPHRSPEEEPQLHNKTIQKTSSPERIISSIVYLPSEVADSRADVQAQSVASSSRAQWRSLFASFPSQRTIPRRERCSAAEQFYITRKFNTSPVYSFLGYLLTPWPGAETSHAGVPHSSNSTVGIARVPS